ncbi:senescence-associated domain-containing protein [Sporobolomyces koalae]|uniref:senescence-associated domain-containing protein n=1 Tax=Sporobolomyces koalae TaxID=500713 RepID=UPI00317D2D17
MTPQRLLTVPDVSLALVSRPNEDDGAAEPLFTGSLTIDRLALPPALPPRRSRALSNSSSLHPAIPGGFEPSRSRSPSPTLSGTGPLHYLQLSLTLPDDLDPIFSMPYYPTNSLDSVASSRNSYLLPNLTGIDPTSLSRSSRSSDVVHNGYIKLTLSATSIDTDAREHFENILSDPDHGSDPVPDSPPPPFEETQELLERNQLYVVDETNGRVLGQLDAQGSSGGLEPIRLEEDSELSHGHMHDGTTPIDTNDGKVAIEAFNLDGKEAVVINSVTPTHEPTWNGATSSTRFSVKPLSAYYKPAPNPEASSIISFGNFISHGLVIGSSLLSQGMEKGAGHYISSRPATNSPMVFQDATKQKFENGNRVTGKAVVYSGKAAGYVGQFATQIGDKIGKATGIQSKPGGPPPTGLKGLVAKSLVAINTVGDHLDQSGKTLLESGSKTANQVVHHKWGSEAAGISDNAGRSIKHCALVYIDARGVTRRALIKAVGKGALKAKMADGSELYLTDSSDSSSIELKQIEQAAISASSTSTSHNPWDKRSLLTEGHVEGGATSPSSIPPQTPGTGASTPVNIAGGYPNSAHAQ